LFRSYFCAISLPKHLYSFCDCNVLIYFHRIFSGWLGNLHIYITYAILCDILHTVSYKWISSHLYESKNEHDNLRELKKFMCPIEKKILVTHTFHKFYCCWCSFYFFFIRFRLWHIFTFMLQHMFYCNVLQRQNWFHTLKLCTNKMFILLLMIIGYTRAIQFYDIGYFLLWQLFYSNFPVAWI